MASPIAHTKNTRTVGTETTTTPSWIREPAAFFRLLATEQALGLVARRISRMVRSLPSWEIDDAANFGKSGLWDRLLNLHETFLNWNEQNRELDAANSGLRTLLLKKLKSIEANIQKEIDAFNDAVRLSQEIPTSAKADFKQLLKSLASLTMKRYVLGGRALSVDALDAALGALYWQKRAITGRMFSWPVAGPRPNQMMCALCRLPITDYDVVQRSPLHRHCRKCHRIIYPRPVDLSQLPEVEPTQLLISERAVGAEPAKSDLPPNHWRVVAPGNADADWIHAAGTSLSVLHGFRNALKITGLAASGLSRSPITFLLIPPTSLPDEKLLELELVNRLKSQPTRRDVPGDVVLDLTQPFRIGHPPNVRGERRTTTSVFDDLKALVVPKPPPPEIVTLARALDQAKIEDPPDKRSFVDAVNQTLERYGYCIVITSSGETCRRMYLDRNNVLMLQRTDGRKRGFKKVPITLAPYTRPYNHANSE